MIDEWEVFGEPDNDDYAASTRLSRKSGTRSGGNKLDAAAKPRPEAQRLVLMKKTGRRVKASRYPRGDDSPDSRPAELALGMI